MRKHGLAIDPNDPSRAVPIGQLTNRQQETGNAAGPRDGRPDTRAQPEPKTEIVQDAPDSPNIVYTTGDSAPGMTDGKGDAPRSAGSFTRETSLGAVGDVSGLDDQTLVAGMKAECAAIRTLDANYPARYHRLGTYIIESDRRLDEEQVHLMLRAEGINKTRAYYAKEIARLYTYEQAVQFPSFRAIKKTIPLKQPRKPKKKPKVGQSGGGDHEATASRGQSQDASPTAGDETVLDRFIRLGIEVRESLGDAALDQAMEQIKAYVPETFQVAFAEV